MRPVRRWEGRLKLYNSNFAPNPRRVRIFLAEKGVAIPRIEVDLAKLEYKTAEFSAVNPFQVIPALELDDGTGIGESIAICRYVEELHPGPNPVWRDADRARDGRDVAAPGGVAPSAADRPGLPSYPPPHGENGGASGGRLGC